MRKANQSIRIILVVALAVAVVLYIGFLWKEVIGVPVYLRVWGSKLLGRPSLALQPPPVPPHERTEEGYPLYYLSKASFWGDEIWFITAGKESRIIHVDILKGSPVVKVEPELPGSALVVRHWKSSWGRDADEAELLVCSQEAKEAWIERIRHEKEEYLESVEPRHLLPPED